MLKDIIKAFIKQLQVMVVVFTKIRIGNKGDGGYVVLKELCEKTVEVYSYGIGNDVSFELDFVQRYPNTKFFLFDPTIPALPQEHKNFNFIKRGMPQACFSPGFESVKPHSILKMDIEWNEWEALEIMGVDVLKKFDQLLIEFHLFSLEALPGNTYSSYFNIVLSRFADKVDRDLFIRYTKVLQMITDHFYIFHIHANNSLPKKKIAWNEIPSLLEVSFVRKGLVEAPRWMYSGPFPSPELDYPNKTDRPDIVDYSTFLPGVDK